MWEYRDSLWIGPDFTVGQIDTIEEEINGSGRVIQQFRHKPGMVIEFAVMVEEGYDNLFDLGVAVCELFSSLETHGLTMEVKRECVVDVLKDGTTVRPNWSNPESKAVA